MALPRPIISVAPMVDVTGRHFRYLMRCITKRTELYTPMLVARQVANRKQHQVAQTLNFDPFEGDPVAQLGGDDPRTMVKAARRCLEAGYKGINLNLGCPARSAQAGRHGAMLMRPDAHDHVTRLVRTMTKKIDSPQWADEHFSVKLRIGVDDHDGYDFFRDFVQRLHEEGGVSRFVVHARKALLGGVRSAGPFTTTRQNRLEEIVPLRHDYAHRLKAELPHLHVEINGGISSMEDIQKQLDNNIDGVMLGRLARDDPFFFAQIDAEVYGDKDRWEGLDPLEARALVLEQYAKYASEEQRAGREKSREMLLKPLNQLFAGMPQKQQFADLLRSPSSRKGSTRYFGDEVRSALDVLRRNNVAGRLNQHRTRTGGPTQDGSGPPMQTTLEPRGRIRLRNRSDNWREARLRNNRAQPETRQRHAQTVSRG